jgi:hypothetical protein
MDGFIFPPNKLPESQVNLFRRASCPDLGASPSRCDQAVTSALDYCQKYLMPTYTTIRQANISATGSRGFVGGPDEAGFERAGGRLKAVTLSVTGSF